MILFLLLTFLVVTNCDYFEASPEDTIQHYEDKEPAVSDIFNSNNFTVGLSDGNRTIQEGSIKMEKIIQPSQSMVFSETKSNSSDPVTLKPETLKDFRPSPQLETTFEYNKFPVLPAIPEPKAVGGDNLEGLYPKLPTAPWLEKSVKYTLTTESPWNTKVKFPTSSSQFKNQPYPFVTPSDFNNSKKNQNNIRNPSIQDEPNPKDALKSTVQTSVVVPGKFSSHGFSGPPAGIAPSYYGSAPADIYIPPNLPTSVGKYEKHHFDYKTPIYDKPPHGFDVANKPHPGGLAVSPWKKIIKILTAIIPIGLLISALTPTVINVSPMGTNYSHGRSRSEKETTVGEQLKSLETFRSLNKEGCEQRVLCELILNSSSSSNSQQYIGNLLETFIGEGKESKKHKQELNRILRAVKKKNCKNLSCSHITDKNISENVDN